ncbi:putative calcineurin binding protein [Cladorrhinum samala]|uniref:Calcineurin binding protein n=1 Tax=Cladorrhinum samala TaxID=585594 RepID=A0AAV9HTU8_9PEZI|nr:putative calcineurin binding protein [Cladorrhinum samala]
MDHQLQQSPDLLPSPTSFSSRGSPSTRSHRTTLSLDLSNIPPLEQPITPSNTLIFTNLKSGDVFLADNLQKIRDLIAQSAPSGNGLHSWSPLRSFGRIIVSFYTVEDAIAARQVWDDEEILGDRCRVYFGATTSVEPQAEGSQHLALPDAGKLFFISPPPSPPHGWESQLEGEPNKMVHAEDLADALAKLRHGNDPTAGMNIGGQSPVSPVEPGKRTQRSRSSTLIFQPSGSPGLPCVTVDDMTDEGLDDDAMDISPATKPIMAHTARPPVELMHNA